MVNLGLIGYGYWGPNLARNISEIADAKLYGICDAKKERLNIVEKRYPGVLTSTNPLDIINNNNIDAIAIATPVSTHYELALKALKAGKHVLVEKPLASSSENVIELIEEAEKQKRILMVDHSFVYTGAVRKIKSSIENGEIGDLYYYDSVRVNLGLFQHDVDVIWDLAIHDLAIMDFLIKQTPISVIATGMSHVSGQPEDVAYINLLFNNNLIAHIHVNWLAPVKIRQTLIGGSQKMIVYDDLDLNYPVKIYDKGLDIKQDSDAIYQMLFSYRWGDMFAPKVDPTETLRVEMLHLVDCIQNNKKPITDGQAGLRTVRILEAATKSMKNRGKEIELK